MELRQFFLTLAIILIAARLFSEIAGRHGIPSVIGELLAGLLLGLNQGILDAETYATLLIVIALTTVAPPFLLKAYYSRPVAR